MTVTWVALCEDIQSKCLTLIVDITDVVTKRGSWKIGERALYTDAVSISRTIAIMMETDSGRIRSYSRIDEYVVNSVWHLPDS